MGTLFGDIADVPIERGKVEISSTLESVPDASPSCPCQRWDISVAHDDVETRFCRRTYSGTLDL